MVRLDSTRCFATASGRLTRRQRRERELAALFGEDCVAYARITDPADLDLTADLMDAVWNAADDLLRDAGAPERQRATIDALPELTQRVLCMWVLDLDLAGKLLSLVMKPTAA